MTALLDTVPIIDVDTHVSEPADLWTSRMSKRWGDATPHVIFDDAAQMLKWKIGDRVMSPVAINCMAGHSEYVPSRPASLEEADPACTDPKARLRRMDEYGVAMNLLYPNIWGFDSHVFLEVGTDYALDCLRAYNDFLTEWAGEDPTRLVPLATLPFWDMDAAVAEMIRCREMGHRGINLAAEFRLIGFPDVIEPIWAPVLAAAQDLGMPVNFHIGFSRRAAKIVRKPGQEDVPYTRSDYVRLITPGFLFNGQAIANVICSGLCERYPQLSFVSVESGVTWVPFLLQALDWQWMSAGAFKDHPERLLPSEYFERQVYMTWWFEKIHPDTLTKYADNIMYETDFPHPTAQAPGPASPAVRARDFVKDNLAGISDDIVRKVLYGNAERLYGISVAGANGAAG